MLPKRTDENDPADWFYFAKDRLKVADLAWNAEGLTPSGVELLQEAAERFLKGYLLAKGWRLAKTHDLLHLISEAERFNPAFRRFKSFATKLTEDFFAQHYPGADLTKVGREYPQLRTELGEIIDLVKQDLPQFSTSL